MSTGPRLRAYIPKHIIQYDIVKCFADSITEFISVETEQEAVMREAASEKPFFVFEKDYFTAYNSPEGIIKCSYWSRSRITHDILYPQSLSWQKLLCEQDGLKVYPEPPGLCFLPSDATCDASLTPGSNNISVYYKDIDIEQFVQTVKKMAACQQGFFFVAHNDKFECVEMENTNNRADVCADNVDYYTHWFSKDLTRIEKRMKHVCFMKENWLKRLPNGQFRLKDYQGNEVLDGEHFRLVRNLASYYAFYAGEERYDDNGEFDYKGVGASAGMICLHPRLDDIFICRIIDDTVYLMCDGEYLCYLSGECAGISTKPELPEKHERLHMEFDGNALIFSRWNEFGYAYEDWVDHRGYTSFPCTYEEEYYNVRMKLYIVKD